MPAGEMFESAEDYEVWDGEIVVKGQPSPWHEAVRVTILTQLRSQLPRDLKDLADAGQRAGNTCG
jgi:hypothetical protein